MKYKKSPILKILKHELTEKTAKKIQRWQKFLRKFNTYILENL